MPYLMKKGFLYDMEDSFDILMDYSVIFIGEEHESRISHHAELTILKGLAERDSNLVLALDVRARCSRYPRRLFKRENIRKKISETVPSLAKLPEGLPATR